MSKLAVIALLGMVVVAAAMDAEIQKKHHKEKDEEYEKETEVYEPYYPSKTHVKADHREWDLTEIVGTDTTHPCSKQYEILGSTVSYSAELADDKDEYVGSVSWSGIVTRHDTCGQCNLKDREAKSENIVKVNYQIVFEFIGEHSGQIICGVASDSIFSEASTTCAVLGGTGAFDGVSGTITWTFGKPAKYAFDIFFP